METGVSVAVRPFKAIALLCAFLAVSLASVAVFSPAWVTAQGFKLSLWEECEGSASREGAQPVWGCKSNLSLHNGTDFVLPGRARLGSVQNPHCTICCRCGS